MVITKKEASERGLKRYFTGTPCKRGHTCERFVGDGNCLECRIIGNSKNIANEESRLYHKNYYNSNKQLVLGKRKRYAASNPDKINALIAKRRSSKAQRTPAWANLVEIQKVYRECSLISKSTGVEHHVDHIIPLHGKLVCGLHVHTNLQILTGSENCSKSNTFEIL